MSISAEQYLLYVQYMFTALLLLALFSIVYLYTTPVRELALIKQGNRACALSLGGAILGFCIAMASSIAHNVSWYDFVLWALIAALIQIAVYFFASRLIPQAANELAKNNVAVGAFLCALSLAIGILNAACLI